MATVNRNNLKQTPIPVVPRTMKIVNPDGTVTRSGQLLLEQLQTAVADAAAGDATGAGAQIHIRTVDINDTTVRTNCAPNLTVQASGKGIKMTGVLRKVITDDLVVVVNVADLPLGTLTIPAATPIKTEVSVSIATKNLVIGTPITFDITASDGSKDKDGIATVTVKWGVALEQVTVTGQWKGPWASGGTYLKGDAVSWMGSSWISLQDDNTGNAPDISPDWWDLLALAGEDGMDGDDGDPGADGIGIPAGGTTGEVLTKTSGTDYDTAWASPSGGMGALTNGSVVFVSSGNPAQDNSNLFWDDTNNRLGIGTNTPGHPLHILADDPPSGGIPIEQMMIENPATSGTGRQANLAFKVYDGATHKTIGWVGTTCGSFTAAPYANATYLENDSTGGVVILSDDATNGHIKMFTGGYNSDTYQRVRIDAAGQVVIREWDGSTQGLWLQLVAQNGTAAKSFTNINFYDVSTLVGQFLATASNYVNSAINVGASGVALMSEVAAGVLFLAAGGSSGIVRINAGGYSSTFTTAEFAAAGGMEIKRGGLKLTGAGSGSYVKADGSGYGTPATTGGMPTGGTAGQIIVKTDGTDYNASWQTPSAGGGSGHATIMPLSYQAIGQGTWAVAADATVYLGWKFSNSSAANGDNISYIADLVNGTYTLLVLWVTGADRGKVDVSVNASVVATLDGYSASTVVNVRSLTTGISMSGGQNVIKFTLSGKNASSSGYVFCPIYMSVWRATPSSTATIAVLVIGGGGSGGPVTLTGNSYAGAGGGAGGYQYDASHTITVTSYSIVIGAGGTSTTSASANGTDSTFNTITATGGGGGGKGSLGANNGSNGGSGGGSSNAGTAGSGSQGHNGGTGSASFGSAASGGGAGVAGTADTSTTGPAGGAGTSNSITGSAVFYAGGGGAGGYAAAAGGAGGNGGGGAGASPAGGHVVGGNGTANTGGGGGGAGASNAGSPVAGGTGGSGVVIISYTTGTVTATGGSITTSGGNTIHTFTTNGTWVVSSIP